MSDENTAPAEPETPELQPEQAKEETQKMYDVVEAFEADLLAIAKKYNVTDLADAMFARLKAYADADDPALGRLLDRHSTNVTHPTFFNWFDVLFFLLAMCKRQVTAIQNPDTTSRIVMTSEVKELFQSIAPKPKEKPPGEIPPAAQSHGKIEVVHEPPPGA